MILYLIDDILETNPEEKYLLTSTPVNIYKANVYMVSVKEYYNKWMSLEKLLSFLKG